MILKPEEANALWDCHKIIALDPKNDKNISILKHLDNILTRHENYLEKIYQQKLQNEKLNQQNESRRKPSKQKLIKEKQLV